MRLEKKAIVNEIRANLEGAVFLILIDYQGLKVRQGEELRRRLAGQKAQFHVVKNTYLRKALGEDRQRLVADALTSTTAIVSGAGDVVETARILAGFQQEQRVLTLKRGLIDGRALSAEDLAVLTTLPPRTALLGLLVGTVAAPMTRLAGVFRQRLASLVYVIQAVQKKKEQPR